MLRAMRSRAAGWVAKIFLGLLILSFAVWGIADVFRGGASQIVAKAGNRDITATEFMNALTLRLRVLQQQTGQYWTPAQARMLGLDQQVLNGLIADAVLDQRAKDLGLTASNETVAQSVRNDPSFRNPAGNFDANRFRMVLNESRLSEAQFVEEQRRFLARQQLLRAIAGNAPAPRPLLAFAHAYSTDARGIDYADLRVADLGEIALPGTEALQAFFEERKASFRAPEYRSVSLLLLTADSLASPESISEDDLRAEYGRQSERFTTAERRTIDQLRFGSMEEAAAARASLGEGRSFDDLVAERNQTLDAISLGTLSERQVIDAATRRAAFALQEGEVSEPVQAIAGPALIRIRSITPAVTRPFEDVREEVARDMALAQARRQLQSIHDAIEDDLGTGATLQEVAEKHGLQLRKIETIDAEGRDADGNAIADLPDDLVDEAFEAGVQLENPPLRLGDNGYAWYVVEAVSPARERSFEEARSRVEAAWRAEETQTRLERRAGELLERARAAGSLTAVTAETGREIQHAEGITRENAPGLPRAVITDVFGTPLNGFGASTGPEENSRIIFFVRSENETPFDPANPGTVELAEIMSRSIQSDIEAAYVSELREAYDVRVYPEAIAAAFGTDVL